MAQQTVAGEQYLVCVLDEQFYGLPAAAVREVVCPPPATALPRRDPAMRGVINLRGQVLPLIDLRTRLGLQADTALTGLAELLTAREEDHVRWLAALERAVQEGSEFTLARDPQRCAFGQWYDQFRPRQRELSEQMRKFDEPHRRIHGFADRVLTMAAQGRRQTAQALLIEARHGALAHLKRLFAATREMVLHRREVAVVVLVSGQPCALGVDRVEALEEIHGEIQSVTGDHANELIGCVDRPHGGGLLQLFADPATWLQTGWSGPD
ncbi:MAG: chemotaxis protein CheW [Fimbriimonadaceae bacterium]|nr:chemotaxis protein CheW [Fimbriimonadaceae bacterium]